MCFPASADEKEALKTQLDGIKNELQELEQNVSSHQSEAWTWGSIALVGLATGDVSGITLQHMIECGGMEALALAVSKCHLRDMPVVLDAIRLLAMDSTASAASLTSMRIMLGPVLHILATLADDRRVALNSFSVLQVLTTDPQSHVVVQENLSAVFGGLSRHEGDEAIQMLGLQVVSNLVEDGTVYDYGKDSDHLQIEKKLFYEKVFPAGWKVRLGQSGAVVAAVRVLRLFRGQQLLQSIAARNLWKLAQAAPENRRLILQEGGIPATIDAMLSHLPVLKSLFVSPNRGVACVPVAHGVFFGAGASRASQIEVLSNGVQVFWKMAWNEPDIQRQIIEQGGLSAIIQAMAAFQGEAVIQTLACGALLAIVRTHNDFNRNALLRSEGLAAVRSAAYCHGSSSGVQWMCAPVEALLNPPKPQPTPATPTSAINLRLQVDQPQPTQATPISYSASNLRMTQVAVQQTACTQTGITACPRPGLLTKPYLSQAIEHHTQRLAIAKEQGDRMGEGRAYANLGNANQLLGDFDKAIKYYTQHLALAKEVGDLAGQGRAYANLGNAYQLVGDFDKAVEHLTQHLALAKKEGNRTEEGNAYSNLGIAYQSLGDASKSLKYHAQHLSIAKEMGDQAGEGIAHGNLGNTHQSLGDVSKAIEHHTQCLANAKMVGDRAREGFTYGNLGVAYRSLGDFPKEVEYLTQHLSFAQEMGDRARQGLVYRNLAIAHQSLGEFSKAVECHTECLAIAKEMGDRVGEGRAYRDLSTAYDALGDVGKAVQYRSQQLTIVNQIAKECAMGNRAQQQDDALCRAMDAIEQLRNEATALFRKLDKNQDGALQVGEMFDPVASLERERSVKFALNDFMALTDTDGDGKITQEELRAHRHASQSDSRGQDSLSGELDYDEGESIAGGYLPSASFFFCLHFSHRSTRHSLRGKRGVNLV